MKNLFPVALIISNVVLFSCNKGDNYHQADNGSISTIKVHDNTDFKDIIRPSVLSQFNTSEFAINKITFEQEKDARFTLFEYETNTGIQSTVMLIKTGQQPINVVDKFLETEKEYIVDCTGSCDCRERYYPATGGVECTCSPCQMKITEIVPDN